MRLRPSPLWLVVLLPFAGVACGATGDGIAKPARLHAPPVTPDIVATRGERDSEYYQRQVMLINKWIRLTGLPTGAAATLLETVRQSRDQSGRHTLLTPDELATALQTWLKAADGREATQRAAAYLVGDRVLRLAWHPFLMADPNQQATARAKLKAVGGQSQLSAASNEVEYQGTWLEDAQRLDPDGPIGQRSALLTLEADCAGGDSPDSYHAIIARLEAVVASAADSEVRVTGQLLEADAYGDIVALAHGVGKANADSTKFLAEAESAKTKAIALYEAALATDSTSRLARGGKLARDRLASGQPLDHARFFCFGE
jgi:hypothetical protein